MNIYMDVCCLCRPFDDFESPDGKRIEDEAEAIKTIFNLARFKNWTILMSEVIESEISKLSNPIKATDAKTFYPSMQKYLILTTNMETRISYFQNLGLKRRDSEHIVLAENNADVFLTTAMMILSKRHWLPIHSLRLPIHSLGFKGKQHDYRNHNP